jgi:hypothetical protein
MDESVSLRFSLVLDGEGNLGGDFSPRFVAPDFDELNEYQETFNDIRFVNGQMTARFNYRLTKVLKPNRTGALKISGITVKVRGKSLQAPDIPIQVSAAGAGTPPPRGYGGSGVGLRGSVKNTRAKNVMVRAEIDKPRAYKGEQLIVSYYLYHRVPLYNLQADKFPVMNGFLREELEMPIQGHRLDWEVVVVDGVEYRRSLLVRYATYPLQEGKLKIDSLSVRYDYAAMNSVDEEDLGSMLFGRGALRKGAERSEIVEINAQPLPQGKPATFTGAVGDFGVTSAVDRYELKANEALNLTVKIEGKGNAASIGEPKVKWPDTLEVYDTKGRAKSGKGGVGEKVFDYVLIPRAPGKLKLPAIELSYFDPTQEKYVTKATEPIEITVLEGAPGSAPPPRVVQQGVAPAPPQQQQEVPRPLRLPEMDSAQRSGTPIWRYLYWICSVLLIGFAGFVGWDSWRQFRGKSRPHARVSDAKQWARLREQALQASRGAAWNEVVRAYDQLSTQVFDSLDRKYGLGARALSRKTLGQALTEDHSLATEEWSKINSLLEFAELVKYASSTGVVSESSARQELPRWVEEGERVTRSLGSKP